jgi:hypothetical protein
MSRLEMVGQQAEENGRLFDEIDTGNLNRCWAFCLNYHQRKDAEGNIFAGCSRTACDCYDSHNQFESIGEEALERLAKLRNKQLGKQRARGRKGKGGKADKAKDDGKGLAYGAVLQYPQEAWCNTCENGTHNDADCTEGGANEGGTRSGQPADIDGILREVAVAAIAKHIENLKSGARSGQSEDIEATMLEVAAAAIAEHIANLRVGVRPEQQADIAATSDDAVAREFEAHETNIRR